MECRQFLHITWRRFVRPLLVIAGILLGWKMRHSFSADSGSVTINYHEVSILLLKMIAVIIVLTFFAMGLSSIMKIVQGKLSHRTRAIFKKYQKILFTIVLLLIGGGLFLATNYDRIIVTTLIVYFIFELWFLKKVGETKNKF